MKKPSREKNGDAIHIKNRHPGGIWGGILNALNYNYHWRYVKKRLPLRRLGSSKHTNCHGNCRNGKANHSDRSQNQTKLEGDNNIINRKATQFIPVTRSSVLSRLKSIVVHDKSKRKGKPEYHRSSTYHAPTIPNPNSAPQTETKDLEVTRSIISRLKSLVVEDKSRRKGQPQYRRSSTYHAPAIPNPNSATQTETKDLAATSSIISRLKSLVVVDKSRRKGQPQLHRSSTYNAPTIPNPNSVSQTETKDLAATDSVATYQSQQLTDAFLKKARSRRRIVDAALCDSKEFIDALSLTNIEESLLENIVRKRDPSSPRRSYSHVALSSQPELQSCGTFPLPRLSGSRVSEGSESFDEVVPDTFAPVVFPRIKGNHIAITQCKDIKEKFTRLDDKKEEQRIAIDGVLDKIPKDREGISDERKIELFRKWAKKTRRGHKEAGTGKKERCYFKRTMSSDDFSMGRYCKLFKSFNKEIKHKDTNILKSEEQDTSSCLPDKRSLARILSMPDLVTCSFRSEDSCRSSADLYEVRIHSELSLGLKVQSELESYIENELKTKTPIENESNCEDAGSIDAIEIELTLEPRIVDSFDPSSQDPELESETCDFDNHESLDISKDQENDCLVRPIQVRPKDLDVFNYVRDVLELSGFSGNESLRMWHGHDQPLDPEMFEEVEFHCLLTGPKCYIGSENHLLCIFDLINEVLIEIYRSSATYWPLPLTRHCHVHPMPFRHHVLEHVWDNISSYLISIHDPTPDDFVSKDIERSYGWTNLQLESECVGLEIEYLMFEELVEDLIFDDLLEEMVGARSTSFIDRSIIDI